MNAIIRLFEKLTSHGEITIVQQGFLYCDRVETRERKLILRDFVILIRALLENKYLQISFAITGKDNANKVLNDLKSIGISVEVLRNELFWIVEIDRYEVDALLSIDLPEDKVKELVEEFYCLVDAAMVYPTGYISWEEYFKREYSLRK